MVGRLQRSLVLLAATLASATPEFDKDCETKTVRTTIPYLGPTTRCTTLPVCDGTETIVVETPFPTCCHTTAKWPPTHTTTTVKPTTKKETTTTAKPTTTKKPTTTLKPTTTKKPTTMTTKTSTSTSTSSTPTAPSGACLNIKPLCSADGFDAAYYANELGGYSNPYTAVYSNYYIVDGLTPLASSLTSVTFFEQNTQPASGGIYPNSSLEVGPFSYTQFPYFPGWTRDTNGGLVVDANNFTMVYSGYFKAPSTGTWQLCASADNENDIYFGDGNAFACLDGSVSTADDPLAMCSGGYFNNAPVCATVDLVEGFFYPIRSVMANWQGPSAFNLTMVAPGVDTTKGSNDFTGYAYPNSCGLFATAPSAP